MAFKLRSGNNTPFKKIGGDKETAKQYNARVMAEYESKLQSHSDSTASYGAQVKIDKLLGEAYDITGNSLEHNKEASEKRDLAKNLHFQNLERGVYPIDRPGSTSDFYLPGYNSVRAEDDSGVVATGSTNPDDLRPKAKPVKPELKQITRMGLKNIDVEGQTIPSTIEPSKRKYMTSSDGKYKINLETGEKTKVKTKKVEKFRRPGGRKVRNIVTGGYNKVQ